MSVFRTVAALLLLAATPAGFAQESPFALYRSQVTFPDVMQALKLAIEEKGMYINNVMHMGEMLERTGKDLGAEKQIYLKAESIEFCSAILSRRMTEENPTRLVNCPFIVSVYVLPEEPDTTYLVHRRLDLGDDSAVMRDVAAMLEAVAAKAAEGF